MTSKYEKLSRFESIQNNFSLLNRRFLDELATLCKKEQISLLPYSPLAGGVLSGKYNQAMKPEDTEGRFADYLKSANTRQRAMAQRFMNTKTLASTQKYLKIAADTGLHPLTLATAKLVIKCMMKFFILWVKKSY